MEDQLSRIAQAFERIADSLERIEAEGLDINNDVPDVPTALCVQHEFPHDIPLGLLHVVPNGRAFKVELSNCSDTETPFVIQTND
jgi:hypothetical protein